MKILPFFSKTYFQLLTILTVLSLGLLLYIFAPKTLAQECLTTSSVARVRGGIISAVGADNPALFRSDKGCVIDLAAQINLVTADGVDLRTYNKLKKLYFDDAKEDSDSGPDKIKSELPASTVINAAPTNNIGANTLYHVAGDLTIDTATLNGSGVAMFFVDRNLTINQNITYGSADQNSGLVFIVQGSINVAPSVTQINAVLISEGLINQVGDPGYDPTRPTMNSPYSFCSNFIGSCNSNSDGGAVADNQLIINGNVIALTRSQPPLFKRNLTGTALSNAVGAEIVNVEPRYLVILKDLFSHNNVVITENTNYGLNLGP